MLGGGRLLGKGQAHSIADCSTKFGGIDCVGFVTQMVQVDGDVLVRLTDDTNEMLTEKLGKPDVASRTEPITIIAWPDHFDDSCSLGREHEVGKSGAVGSGN